MALELGTSGGYPTLTLWGGVTAEAKCLPSSFALLSPVTLGVCLL